MALNFPPYHRWFVAMRDGGHFALLAKGGSLLAVLSYFASRCDRGWESFPGNKRVAFELRLCLRQVKYDIARLVELRYIHRAYRTGNSPVTTVILPSKRATKTLPRRPSSSAAHRGAQECPTGGTIAQRGVHRSASKEESSRSGDHLSNNSTEGAKMPGSNGANRHRADVSEISAAVRKLLSVRVKREEAENLIAEFGPAASGALAWMAYNEVGCNQQRRYLRELGLETIQSLIDQQKALGADYITTTPGQFFGGQIKRALNRKKRDSIKAAVLPPTILDERPRQNGNPAPEESSSPLVNAKVLLGRAVKELGKMGTSEFRQFRDFVVETSTAADRETLRTATKKVMLQRHDLITLMQRFKELET